GRALRPARARVRPEGVPEQDRARPPGRRRRQAAARADPGLLRLLRLALRSARALATCAPRSNLSRSPVRRGGAQVVEPVPDPPKPRQGSLVPRRPRPFLFRAPLWPRLAAAARRGAPLLGGPGRARLVGGARAARAGRSAPARGVAAQAPVPHPHR